MHRLGLADQLPYRFCPPRLSRTWVRATRSFRRHMLSNEHRIVATDIEGLEHLTPLLERNEGVLLTPNHPGRADGLLMLDLGDRLDRPFCAMAAYQIFHGSAGLRHFLFPRLGVFPVDREGADLSAFKAAVEVLSRSANPLVLFPEGEVYYLADRLTPLREGAAAIAIASARKRAEAGQTVWVVPLGLKYRFPDDHDPRPAFRDLLDRLETRLTWRPRPERSLLDRIYDLAAAVLALKELEYFGQTCTGTIPERIAHLRTRLLEALEDRCLGKRRDGDPVPVRVKELRRACLEALGQPETTIEQARRLRRDLDDVFLVVQAFSYPGNYLDECPTLERMAETLSKLAEDLLLDNDYAPPLGPRRAILRIGAPIDAGALLSECGKPRQAVPRLIQELEHRIQAQLDAIGPGRLLEPSPPAVAPAQTSAHGV